MPNLLSAITLAETFICLAWSELMQKHYTTDTKFYVFDLLAYIITGQSYSNGQK